MEKSIIDVTEQPKEAIKHTVKYSGTSSIRTIKCKGLLELANCSDYWIDESEIKNGKILQQLSDTVQQLQECEIKNGKVLQQLSDTVLQLQTKLSKMEQMLDRNVLGMRLLLMSFTPSCLGKMLLSAVKDDDVQQVLLLLEFGADIEFQDDDQNRPIHVAVFHNHPRILEILLENKCDIESHGEYQRTALHLVGHSNSLECAKILIDKGANLESLDEWHDTPIMHTARNGFNEILELLLQKGANVNATQMSGWTALHRAAANAPLTTIQILVKNGANVGLKDQQGHTPLDLAVDKKRYLIADFLQKL